MAQQLQTSNEIDVLAAQWKEAKESEQAWAAHRKGIEDQIAEKYDNFKELIDSLEGKASLTASASIGDLKVTVGYTLAYDQVGATNFMAKYPLMNGVLFKTEFKGVARAITNAIVAGGELGEDLLSNVVTYKEKRPAFSQS